MKCIVFHTRSSAKYILVMTDHSNYVGRFATRDFTTVELNELDGDPGMPRVGYSMRLLRLQTNGRAQVWDTTTVTSMYVLTAATATDYEPKIVVSFAKMMDARYQTRLKVSRALYAAKVDLRAAVLEQFPS
jgi:hypothetical protein